MQTLRRLSAACGVASALFVLGGAFAQEAELPHAYPRKGVTQVLDNTRVTVWEVNWHHGDEQPYHRHRYDMAGVFLRYGTVVITSLDGTATSGPAFDVPRPYFQRRGVTHKEEARGVPGTPERLAIMVDLKDAATDMMFIDDPEPAAWPRDGAANVLENDRVRMWDHTWRAGTPAVKRVYRNDVVEVVVEGGTLRVTGVDGRAETRVLEPKQARYVSRGTLRTDEHVSGAPRVIAIELK